MLSARYILCILLLSTVTRAPARDLYLSPHGDDANAGTRLQPLASLAGARDAVRKQIAFGITSDLTVHIHGGSYTLTEPVVFTAADSAPEGQRITYQAVQGERPIFSGGRIIRGFKVRPDGSWEVRLPEVADGSWRFEQLFVNGKRAIRARTPNEGYHYIHRVDQVALKGGGARPEHARQEVRIAPDVFARLPAPSSPSLHDVILVVYHKWDISRKPLVGAVAESHTVHTSGRGMKPWNAWVPGSRFHLENLPSALDAPGEWFLSRDGVLRYFPREGERPDTAHVVAPMTRELLLFKGDANGQSVRNLSFKGLSFQHNQCLTPPKGFGPVQAATDVDAAVMLDHVRTIRFEDCAFTQLGTYALYFRQNCRDSGVFHSFFQDLGAGGIRIGTRDLKVPEASATGQITIDNCIVHQGGRIFPSAVGIWIGHSADNQITHNEISDLFYTGISVGWQWGYGKSGAQRNRIAYNHIHHLGQNVLSDMGGIYTLGPSAGTEVVHNVIHDIQAYNYGGWGLYTDEGSSDIEMAYNLVYHTEDGGFHQHYGRDNRIHNNILAYQAKTQAKFTRAEAHPSLEFHRNIVLYDSGSLFGGDPWKVRMSIDHNLYWHSLGQPVSIADKTFEEWQASGHDRHSLIEDPLFIDPENLDFRLQPGSPAFSLGFESFDPKQAGVYGDPDWIQRAQSLPIPVSSDAPPPPPLPLYAEFEDRVSGEPPLQGRAHTEDRPDAIVITDTTAASGRHSLQFTDSPDFEHSYTPHLSYRPDYRDGIARVGFALRISEASDFYAAWRDDAEPYQTGPYLSVRNGRLHAENQSIPLPQDEWIRIEISAALGDEAGTWDLSLTLPDESVEELKGLKNRSPGFQELKSVKFVSNGRKRALTYLDAIRITPEVP